MTTGKKIMIGGLGALTPIIMNLLVVDLNILLINLTVMALIGYAIRVIVLFYLGGVVAYLHKDEKSPVKVFELGIVAPALITALLNAGHVEVPNVNLQSSATQTGSLSIVATAYAQEPEKKEEVKTFSMPKETGWQQLLRGLTGRSSNTRKVWFVIAGSHEKLEDANKQATQINENHKEVKAEIYAPFGADSTYKVVVGENLLFKQAELMKQQKTRSDVLKDLKLWRLPTED